jgi:tetratricopeptide (TPR) repeat protein
MKSFWGLKFLSYPAKAILFWILVWGNPCWAETPVSSDRNGARVESGARERDKIERAWFAHRRFLEKGHWEKSRSELEKVYQWKLDQGIRNHYAYALALVRESQWDARIGKSGGAAELLDYAQEMAPHCSQVSMARARWLGSQILDSWENAPRAVFAWFDGIWLSFHNQEEALPQIANLTLWILMSFLLTFVVFALSMFIRYYSFFAHHLKRLTKADMGSIPWFFLTLAVLFSPFFLGLGWMWMMAFWILIFWVYAGRPDRLVTIALLLLLLLLPTGIRFYSSVLLSLTGNGVPEIFSANTGAWNGELYRRILVMNQSNPEDQDVLQAVGLMEKRMGKFREAEQRFLQLAKLDPRSAPALVNLGNVYLATDRLDQAMEAYRNAARLEPLRAEAYYNLGQAYLLKHRKKEGEEEIQRARSLDPALIFHQARISSRNPNRLVIDRTIDLSQVWRRILAPTPERDEIARGLWSTLWGGVPLEYGDIALGFLFLLLAGVHLVSRKLSFIRNSDFPQRISLIVPGLGHLIRGNSKEGILYLFIFILFVVQVILWGGWLSNPMVLNPNFSLPRMVILAILFLLFYGRVQHRMKHIRSQEEGPDLRDPSQ